MRQTQLVQQRREQDSSNPTIKILEGVNPLEAPISPGEERCTSANRSVRFMAQALSQIVAELPHVDRHFVVVRREVTTDLHIYVTKTPRPIRKQMPASRW